MLSSSSRCWHNADRCLLVEGWKVFGYWGGRRITEAQKKCPTIENFATEWKKRLPRWENTCFLLLQIWGFFRAEVLNLALLQICWAKKSKWDWKSFGCFRNVNLIMPLHPWPLVSRGRNVKLAPFAFSPFQRLKPASDSHHHTKQIRIICHLLNTVTNTDTTTDTITTFLQLPHPRCNSTFKSIVLDSSHLYFNGVFKDFYP